MRKNFLLVLPVLISYTGAFAQDSTQLVSLTITPISRCSNINIHHQFKIQDRIICTKPSSRWYKRYKPLYVIDGVIANKAKLRRINPDDIDSISVLKNSEVLTLYGKLRKGGVIIITTKKKRTIKIKDAISCEPLSVAVQLATGNFAIQIIDNNNKFIQTEKLITR